MFAFGFGLLTPASGAVSALADLIGAVRCEPQEGVGPGGPTIENIDAAEDCSRPRRHSISAIAFQNKAAVYDLLFRTAAETQRGKHYTGSIGRRLRADPRFRPSPNKQRPPRTRLTVRA